MKALLVILNKDNAPALKKCLASIAHMDGLCEDFDVLILDGASKDNSAEISKEFEGKYPCIKFKIQERLGGTGFARREACEYALKNDYDFIVWGDSENEYSPNYMKSMLAKLRHNDAVGGVPKVRGGFYAHAFAWYHALHLIIPKLYKIHIPGNNKGEKTEIFRRVQYPETVRAEDYGFSILLRKYGIKLRQDVAWDAVVFVSLPENFREVRAWQRARAKGVAQVLRKIEVKPWDSLGWGMIPLLFLTFGILSIISIWPILIYTILYFIGSIIIFLRSRRYVKKFRYRYFLGPFLGIIIYSIYSLLSLYYYFSLKD